MEETPQSRWKRYRTGGALVAAGLLAGGALAGTVAANAASESATPSSSASAQDSPRHAAKDETQSMRSDEKLLTGSTAEKVRAAAVAKYPDATVQRVETDSDGVYEAHLLTADGERVTVQVGKDFSVTAVQTGRGGGRH